MLKYVVEQYSKTFVGACDIKKGCVDYSICDGEAGEFDTIEEAREELKSRWTTVEEFGVDMYRVSEWILFSHEYEGDECIGIEEVDRTDMIFDVALGDKVINTYDLGFKMGDKMTILL